MRSLLSHIMNHSTGNFLPLSTSVEMKTLTSLTDYRFSAHTAQLRQLEKRMQSLLIDETSEIEKFRASFESDIAKTQANVKAMRIAVSQSKRPGAVVYRQSPPEPREISTLHVLLGGLETAETQRSRTLNEAETVLNKERARWRQHAHTSPLTLGDWLAVYGRPKRKIGAFERSLSRVSRPLTIVAGAASKDGLVKFKSEKSNAMTLRLGSLIN